jgi:O-acetyl-ADP-ribose deacetylase (regulator of RNase III)
MNHYFKGKHIGLPQIGCGLAGGDWDIVRNLIQEIMIDCDVTVVIYNQS